MTSVQQPGGPRRLGSLAARPKLDGCALPLEDEGEWLELATIVLADYLEQVRKPSIVDSPHGRKQAC